MESLFRQINNSFEVVICDNCSYDGSLLILQEYAQNGKIKLIIKKSSRGKGRQIAFENSIGEYIISGVDTDDKLKATFHDFISLYHKYHEGYMLSACTIHIIPRNIVKEIGGWRDLTWGEDVDFYERAKSLGRQHDINFPMDIVERGDNKRSFLARLLERYDASKCYYMIGKTITKQVEMSVLFQKPIIFLIALSALISCKSKHVKKFNYSNAKWIPKNNI
jgi:glycosyltransferase involved in cell wall biosynthesis